MERATADPQLKGLKNKEFKIANKWSYAEFFLDAIHLFLLFMKACITRKLSSALKTSREELSAASKHKKGRNHTTSTSEMSKPQRCSRLASSAVHLQHRRAAWDM